MAVGHNKPVHEQIAAGAIDMADRAWTSQWLPGSWKQAIMDGSWQEDYTPPDYLLTPLGNVCRTRNHGYNPITDSTAGIFVDWQWLCTSGGSATTARQYARSLWDTMCTLGQPTGDDGTYLYLGRLVHLMGDMSSFVHVHPQDVTALEHSDFESAEEDYFVGPIEGPVIKTPTDPLDPSFEALLDPFTISRLESKQFSSNDIESFMEAVARLTYFRGTFWGEVIFRSGDWGDEGDATDEMTAATSFGGYDAPAQPNTLRTMFGAGNVRYVNDWDFDDYFVIEDREGNSLTWGSTFDDQWFPCSGGTVDGHRTIDGGGSDTDAAWDEDVRTTGRFFFKEPWIAYPVNYPDGQGFGDFSLGYYISQHAMQAGACYTAGLLRVGAGPVFGDFNRDGDTNFGDLEMLAGAWLTGQPSVDAAPVGQRDGSVNFGDFGLLGRYWESRWH